MFLGAKKEIPLSNGDTRWREVHDVTSRANAACLPKNICALITISKHCDQTPSQITRLHRDHVDVIAIGAPHLGEMRTDFIMMSRLRLVAGYLHMSSLLPNHHDGTVEEG